MDARCKLDVENGIYDARMGSKLGHVNEFIRAWVTKNTSIPDQQPLHVSNLRDTNWFKRQPSNC